MKFTFVTMFIVDMTALTVGCAANSQRTAADEVTPGHNNKEARTEESS
jgi:hypothetical protein